MSERRSHKSSSAQIATRTNEIYSLMVNGVTDKQKLRAYMDAHNWQLTPTQKDRYIRKATLLLKQSLEESQEECLAIATRRLEDLYAKFNAAKDYQGALATLREYIRLKCATVNPNADTGIQISILKVDSALPAPQQPQEQEPVTVIDVTPEPAEETD